MYWLDTVILCILAGGALTGALIGFLWQVFWITSVGAGLYSTILLNDAATYLLQRSIMQGSDPSVARGVAFLLVFALIFVVFLAGTLVVHRLLHKARLQWLNRILGSAAVAVVLAVVLGLAFQLLAIFPASRPLVEQSKIAPVLVAGIQSLLSQLPDDYRKTLEEKIGPPQGHAEQPAAEPPISQPASPTLHVPPTPTVDQIINELSKSKK